MLKNILNIAIRNLIRYKTFSAINIIGLSMGITCFIALALYVLDELSYDRFNKNADRIYRVCVHSVINGKEMNNSKSAAPTGSTLLRDLPEVESFTRTGYFGEYTMRYNDKIFREGNVYTADSTYFRIFSFPLIYGNPETVLSKPNCIVLTETTSRKYFGAENPVGKSLLVEGKGAFLVTGLMQDFPRKSHFRCSMLLSMCTYPENLDSKWLGLSYVTFILLKPGADPAAVNQKMKRTVMEYVGPQAEAALGVPLSLFMTKGNKYEFFLQPLTSIYLRSQNGYAVDPNTEWGDVTTSNIAYTYIFGAVAIFILLIAVINFMNLSTARSEKRAKEVGIRKTLGSGRGRLIWQFISESVLTSSISVMLALLILPAVIGLFNKLTQKDLGLEYFNNIYTIPALIVFTLLVGIIAGSYPAFYLSSFQPGHILKKGDTRGKRKHYLRSALVIVQFAISITLIIGMIIIKSQLEYIQNKDLGFNKEYLLSIPNANVLGNKLKTYKEELLKNPDISFVSNASVMFAPGVPGNGYLYEKRTGADPISFQYLDVDEDFLKTFDIKMKEGRFFEKDFPADTSSVIINEAGVKECAAINPVGKDLTMIGNHNDSKTYRIAGVVNNFNYESLHQEIRPLALHLGPVKQPGSILYIRINSKNIKQTISFIRSTWEKFTEGENCYFIFIDRYLAKLYSLEEKTNIITTAFSILAIFIACLGLFGLAAFVTEQRVKEIGIRKVLGASVMEIVILLSKEFTKWVILANIIAWPAAYYVMHNWLQDFAYRVNIAWYVFVLAGVIALIIALATVSYQAVKAALANPVKSLKYE